MNTRMIAIGMAALLGGAAAQAACTCANCACAKPAYAKPDSPSCRASKMPFKLGVAGFTFFKKSFDEALATMKRIDCHYLCHKDFFVKYDATDEQLAAYKAKIAAAGVETLATGPLYADNEKALREQFEFAKKMGIRVLVGVPFEKNEKGARVESDRVLDVVERLVKEYDMVYAVHNHGPDMPELYPTAEAALARIGGRDRRIGVCLDVGHEFRFGYDPVAFIRAHADRIYDVHLKNIGYKGDKPKKPKFLSAKEGPRGVLDIPGILKALAEVGYSGCCHIEYEKDFEDNVAELAESVGYYRGVMDAIHVSPTMQPVPAGANTLTEQEKAEGWTLLFDGKNLPTDKWVGAKNEWKLERFPARGWYVRDGALSMRPMTTIANGKWVPLPEEDRKMAGGGDIVTVKKYSDFVFKFDFRLTEAANSGVKYFYNEGKHKNSCMEYQVLDSGHPDYDKPNQSGVEHVHRIAALYDLIATPLADAAVKPLGQWNSGMIVSKGRHVEHWLNGVKVLEYERGSQMFRDCVAKSKYLAWQDKDSRWGEADEGRLLLQDHGDSTVSYCNLKVKEL